MGHLLDREIIKIYHRKLRQNAQKRRKKKENLFEILNFSKIPC